MSAFQQRPHIGASPRSPGICGPGIAEQAGCRVQAIGELGAELAADHAPRLGWFRRLRYVRMTLNEEAHP
jgi:hypothetical protein